MKNQVYAVVHGNQSCFHQVLRQTYHMRWLAGSFLLLSALVYGQGGGAPAAPNPAAGGKTENEQDSFFRFGKAGLDASGTFGIAFTDQLPELNTVISTYQIKVAKSSDDESAGELSFIYSKNSGVKIRGLGIDYRGNASMGLVAPFYSLGMVFWDLQTYTRAEDYEEYKKQTAGLHAGFGFFYPVSKQIYVRTCVDFIFNPGQSLVLSVGGTGLF